MPGKPHGASFPKERFTVKDRFGLDSKREGLNPTSGPTVTLTASAFCCPAIATDRCRDVFSSKSTRYSILSIGTDSPRRT